MSKNILQNSKEVAMVQSRRDFVTTFGIGTAGAYIASLVSTKHQESLAFAAKIGLSVEEVINIANNENPLGPGKAVLDAIDKALGTHGEKPGRYPFPYAGPLNEAIAQKFSVRPENVLVGAGSTQILVNSTHVYTSNHKALVGSLPTYEECFGYASVIGHRTKAVPLTQDYTMDLDKTYHACKGAGMLFYCNPNNPVASLVDPSASKDFLPRVLKMNSDLRVLVDEAYIDYVTTPGHETMIPLAIQEPRVIVARTFSKAYGMAGLRIGYAIAHEDTIAEMKNFHAGNSVSSLSYAAAIAGVERDRVDPTYIPDESKRNDKARTFTMNWFKNHGYEATNAQTNFMFVDVKMPVEDFQSACAKSGILVGRPFPPLWTHCRISIGTMEQMQRAVKVFEQVLDRSKSAAA